MCTTTLEVDGIRSTARKGAFPWLAPQSADFACLQEARVREHQLAAAELSLTASRRTAPFFKEQRSSDHAPLVMEYAL